MSADNIAAFECLVNVESATSRIGKAIVLIASLTGGCTGAGGVERLDANQRVSSGTKARSLKTDPAETIELAEVESMPPAAELPEILGMCVHPGGPHNGTVLKAFALDTTETSLADYQKCVVAGACQRIVMADMTDGRVPVDSVTWFDAVAYCEWTGKSLPTWDQWSWALVGGDADLAFPWGDAPPDCDRYVATGTGKHSCITESAPPVGSRPRGASRFGCLDLVGSVREWLLSGEGQFREVANPRIKGDPGDFMEFRRRGVFARENTLWLGFRCAQELGVADSRTKRSIRAPRADVGSSKIDVDFVRIQGGGRITAFEIMVSEVTVAQYSKCVTSGACPAPELPGPPSVCNWDIESNADHPMNCVLPTQAETFCGVLAGSLPTEEQWELAARRGDTNQLYPWTRQDQDLSVCDFANIALDSHQPGCSSGGTFEVGSLPQGATAEGVQDMFGNVWELVRTEDSYVRRGSGWDSWIGRQSSAPSLSDRMTVNEAYTDSTGFRCVRSLP